MRILIQAYIYKKKIVQDNIEEDDVETNEDEVESKLSDYFK